MGHTALASRKHDTVDNFYDRNIEIGRFNRKFSLAKWKTLEVQSHRQNNPFEGFFNATHTFNWCILFISASLSTGRDHTNHFWHKDVCYRREIRVWLWLWYTCIHNYMYSSLFDGFRGIYWGSEVTENASWYGRGIGAVSGAHKDINSIIEVPECMFKMLNLNMKSAKSMWTNSARLSCRSSGISGFTPTRGFGGATQYSPCDFRGNAVVNDSSMVATYILASTTLRSIHRLKKNTFICGGGSWV